MKRVAILVNLICLAGIAGCAADKVVLNDTYKNAAKYKYGQSRADLAGIEEEIRKADANPYRRIEARLLILLNSPTTETEAKAYFCRYLGMVGSAKSVPTLAGLLGDPHLSHPARMALEPMKNEAAGKALRNALGQVKGTLLVGVIGSVGARRDAKAIPALVKLSGSDEPAVANAAATALGEIGTVEATRELQKMAASAAEAKRGSIAQALIACAGQMEKSEVGVSAAIFRDLTDARYPRAIRLAAAKGVMRTSDPVRAVALIRQMLESEDPVLRSAGIAALKDGDNFNRMAVFTDLPSLPPAAQVAVLNILPDLRSPVIHVRSQILRVLYSAKNEDIRVAAVACLATCGEPDDVPMLVKMAATDSSQALKDAAAQSLARLGKKGVDEALVGMLNTSDVPTRQAVITALAARNCSAALPEFARLMNGTDRDAASQAIAAIGAMGGGDQLTALTELISKANDNDLRSAAEKAAGAICTRIADEKVSGPIVLGSLERAAPKPAKIALIRLLSRVKGDAALAALVNATKDADAEIREAAIRALADWPNLAAADTLLEIARVNENERLSIIALQGCIRLAGQRAGNANRRIALYRTVIDLARRVDEKRQAIAGLGGINNIAAVNELTKYAADPAIGADAARAAIRLSAQRQVNPKSRVVAALEKFKAQQFTPQLMQQLDKAIEAARIAPSREN